jgi:flagellar protein FlaG
MGHDISTIGARLASVAQAAPLTSSAAQAKPVPPEPLMSAGAGIKLKPEPSGTAGNSLDAERLQTEPVVTLSVKPEPAQKIDPQELLNNLHEAIAKLNEQAANNGRGLKFTVDEELNRHIITVSNTHTGEVVRQIPTAVALKVAHNIEDVKGLLLDERT